MLTRAMWVGEKGCLSFNLGIFFRKYLKSCLQRDLGLDGQSKASICRCWIGYLLHFLSFKSSNQHQILCLFVRNCAPLLAVPCCEERPLLSLPQHSWQCKQVCLCKQACCQKNGSKTRLVKEWSFPNEWEKSLKAFFTCNSNFSNTNRFFFHVFVFYPSLRKCQSWAHSCTHKLKGDERHKYKTSAELLKLQMHKFCGFSAVWR